MLLAKVNQNESESTPTSILFQTKPGQFEPHFFWSVHFDCLTSPFPRNFSNVLCFMLRLPRISGRTTHEQTLCWPDYPSPTKTKILWPQRWKIRLLPRHDHSYNKFHLYSPSDSHLMVKDNRNPCYFAKKKAKTVGENERLLCCHVAMQSGVSVGEISIWNSNFMWSFLKK